MGGPVSIKYGTHGTQRGGRPTRRTVSGQREVCTSCHFHSTGVLHESLMCAGGQALCFSPTCTTKRRRGFTCHKRQRCPDCRRRDSREIGFWQRIPSATSDRRRVVTPAQPASRAVNGRAMRRRHMTTTLTTDH